MAVGGTGVSVGVPVGIGVAVDVGVAVDIGVGTSVGPNNCASPQPEITKLIASKLAVTKPIVMAHCFEFIGLRTLTGASGKSKHVGQLLASLASRPE